MSFASPLTLLLLVPLAFAGWRLLRRGRRSGIRFSVVGRIPAKAAGWRARVAALTPFILLAGLALLVLAAARPRTSLAREKKSVDAIAITMTVDVSGSMEALDLTPRGETFSRETTRLAVVKKLFAQFVEKRPDDLIGLVTFGGYAATRSPLTADHEALLNVLKGVEIPSIAVDAQGQAIARDEQMTAIGDGLATALARLKDAKPKTKIVILLSDGVSNTGAVEPDEAARAAAKMNVKVYAIGVGTRSRRTPIFGRDFFGRTTIQYADMTFDEQQLKSIARQTGGTYFPVNDRDSLEKALEEIDQLETTEIDADIYNRWDEHFAGFLLLGTLCVLVAVSLSMSATRRVAAFLPVVLLLSGCWTVRESEHPAVVVQALKAGREVSLQIAGFDATVTTYDTAYSYTTVTDFGGPCYGCHGRHGGWGGIRTYATTDYIPRTEMTSAYRDRAADALERAGCLLKTRDPHYQVEVVFEGPYREDGDGWATVGWMLCSAFTAEYGSQNWNARLRIHDLTSGRLVFSRDLTERDEAVVWGPIPIFSPGCSNRSSDPVMKGLCLTALTDRAVAETMAFFTGGADDR